MLQNIFFTKALKFTDKNENKFSPYIQKFRWNRCKVIYEEVFLIYEDMRKYLTIYEEAVSHI